MDQLNYNQITFNFTPKTGIILWNPSKGCIVVLNWLQFSLFGIIVCNQTCFYKLDLSLKRVYVGWEPLFGSHHQITPFKNVNTNFISSINLHKDNLVLFKVYL